MSNIIELISTSSETKTMSSREIAELTKKRHKNVIADIEKMLSELEIDRLKFQHIYLDSYGREQKEYLSYTVQRVFEAYRFISSISDSLNGGK